MKTKKKSLVIFGLVILFFATAFYLYFTNRAGADSYVSNCFPGTNYYRSTVTGDYNAVGGQIRLGDFTPDPNRIKPGVDYGGKIFDIAMDNPAVYLGIQQAVNGVVTDYGLTWEVSKHDDGSFSKTQDSFRPFWRTEKLGTTGKMNYDNAKAEPQYTWHSGDTIDIKVFIPQDGYLALSVSGAGKSFQTNPIPIAGLKKNGQHTMKIVNAMDQAGNEGKPTQSTNAKLTDTEWLNRYVIDSAGNKKYIDNSAETALTCTSSTVTVSKTNNNGGEKIDIVGSAGGSTTTTTIGKLLAVCPANATSAECQANVEQIINNPNVKNQPVTTSSGKVGDMLNACSTNQPEKCQVTLTAIASNPAIKNLPVASIDTGETAGDLAMACLDFGVESPSCDLNAIKNDSTISRQTIATVSDQSVGELLAACPAEGYQSTACINSINSVINTPQASNRTLSSVSNVPVTEIDISGDSGVKVGLSDTLSQGGTDIVDINNSNQAVNTPINFDGAVVPVMCNGDDISFSANGCVSYQDAIYSEDVTIQNIDTKSDSKEYTLPTNNSATEITLPVGQYRFTKINGQAINKIEESPVSVLVKAGAKTVIDSALVEMMINNNPISRLCGGQVINMSTGCFAVQGLLDNQLIFLINNDTAEEIAVMGNKQELVYAPVPFGFYDVTDANYTPLSAPYGQIKLDQNNWLRPIMIASSGYGKVKADFNFSIDPSADIDGVENSNVEKFAGTVMVTSISDNSIHYIGAFNVKNAIQASTELWPQPGQYMLQVSPDPSGGLVANGKNFSFKSLSTPITVSKDEKQNKFNYLLASGSGSVEPTEVKQKAQVIVIPEIDGQPIYSNFGELTIFEKINDQWDAMYPGNGSTVGLTLPFTNTTDKTWLTSVTGTARAGSINTDTEVDLFVNQTFDPHIYRFEASNGQYSPVVKDITISDQNPAQVIYMDFKNPVNNTPTTPAKPTPDNKGGFATTSARPAGMSDEAALLSGNPYVTIISPDEEGDYQLDQKITIKAVLDNFTASSNANGKVDAQFLLDDEVEVCFPGNIQINTNKQEIDCVINPVNPDIIESLGSGSHSVTVNVARHLASDQGLTGFSFSDDADFCYARHCGASVDVTAPRENAIFPQEKKDYTNFKIKLNGLDGTQKHVKMFFDDTVVCDFSTKGGTTPEKAGDPAVQLNIDPDQDEFSCDVAFNDPRLNADARDHAFIGKVYLFDEAGSWDDPYKGYVQICLTNVAGKGGEACAGGAGGTIINHANIQAGELGAIQLTKLGRLSEASDLAEVVANIIRFLFGAVGLALVIAYVFAAFKYLTGAGNEDSVAAAKKWFVFATVGLIVVLLAAATVEFVGQRIAGRSILSTGGLKVPVLKLPKITEATTDSTAGLRVYVATLISDGIILLSGMAGLVALFFVMLGGYYYIFSGGDQAQAEKGKKALTGAIVGFLIVVFAVTIVSLAQYVTRVDWKSDANWKNSPTTTVQKF